MQNKTYITATFVLTYGEGIGTPSQWSCRIMAINHALRKSLMWFNKMHIESSILLNIAKWFERSVDYTTNFIQEQAEVVQAR